MPNSPLSAQQFFDREKEAKACYRTAEMQNQAARMDTSWQHADFMDFAERYADYVANFETIQHLHGNRED